MPATKSDIAQVTKKRQEAAAYAEKAGKLTAGARTFEDRVMSGVREARAARGASTLETAIGTTTGQLATAPAEMRARLADVNPLQTDVLTARQTGQTLSTLATLGAVGRAREGTIQEVVGAGTNTLLARADLLRSQAERAATESETIMNQLKYEEDLRARKEEERVANEYLKLAQQKETRLGLKEPEETGETGSADYWDDVIGIRGEDIDDETKVRMLMELYDVSEERARQDLGIELVTTQVEGMEGTWGLGDIVKKPLSIPTVGIGGGFVEPGVPILKPLAEPAKRFFGTLGTNVRELFRK